jgi:hypothetical protein
MAAQFGETLRIRVRDEDRDCATKIDNAKRMTLHAFPTHLHMFKKHHILEVMLVPNGVGSL